MDLTFKHILHDIPARIIGSSSRGSAKSIEPVTYRFFHYEATVLFPRWIKRISTRTCWVSFQLFLSIRDKFRSFTYYILSPLNARDDEWTLLSCCNLVVAHSLQHHAICSAMMQAFIRCLYRLLQETIPDFFFLVGEWYVEPISSE